MKFTDISQTQERNNFQKFLAFRIGDVKMQISCLGNVMCVITFPKHSIDGGQYGASLHYPLHQFRPHDIYGHFLNGNKQTALVHYR